MLCPVGCHGNTGSCRDFSNNLYELRVGEVNQRRNMTNNRYGSELR